MADALSDDKKLEAFWRAYREKDMPFEISISRDFKESVDAEINTENDLFPTCMSERIKLIYDDECNVLYEKALRLSA